MNVCIHDVSCSDFELNLNSLHQITITCPMGIDNKNKHSLVKSISIYMRCVWLRRITQIGFTLMW